MGETCYTAGLDGVICCWTIPSTVGLDVYQAFGYFFDFFFLN